MNQIQMSAKLYDIRDAVRSLRGIKYPSEMSEIGDQLLAFAKLAKKTTLEVAIDVCKTQKLEGMDMMMIMAAAVELSEMTK